MKNQEEKQQKKKPFQLPAYTLWISKKQKEERVIQICENYFLKQKKKLYKLLFGDEFLDTMTNESN